MSGDRKIVWWVALIPFLVLVVALFFVIRFFGTDALGGASQVALLFAAGVGVAIAMLVYKIPWKALESSIVDNTRTIGVSLLILLLIGAISGSWMVSGVVPTLIFYGMKIITPKLFLFAACLICAVISLVTGSSWTTVATIGVALLGIGTAQGYSPGWIAGAIISGAYFGDKISPLSDTTVLASSASGTPLFDHIHYMLFTTVPSMTIAAVIFLVASLTYPVAPASNAVLFSDALENSFNISPWLLLIPVFTGFLVARKVPALLTLFLSALAAGVTALFAQPDIIHDIATGFSGVPFEGLSFKEAFRGMFIMFSDSTAVPTGNGILDSLVETFGMRGMLDTIFLILCASAFGGVLAGAGMISSITGALVKRISSRTGLVSSTVATGLASNMMTGDQYLSIILCCSLFKDLYSEQGYEGRLLSRSIEDSATVTSVLIPWNSCGMTQSTVLKVPTIEYLPYCFFNILSPLMSIFIAFIGFKIFRKEENRDQLCSEK